MMKEELYIFNNNNEYPLYDLESTNDTTYIQCDKRKKNRWIDGKGLESNVPERMINDGYIKNRGMVSVFLDSEIIDLLFSEDIELFYLGKQLLINILKIRER